MIDTKDYQQLLSTSFEKWAGEKTIKSTLLPESGSNRKYILFESSTKSAIGAYNPDKKENNAFIYLTRHFLEHELNVPKLYNEDIENNIYLQQNLGDITLYSYINSIRQTNDFTNRLTDIYKKVIDQLPKFQITASKGLDFSICYPRSAFDKQSMIWDLNYFKYYFLRLAQIQFDEQKLEDDFNTFTDYLLQTDCNYFLYRDFQSRNIMLYDEMPYFIDYQGGRKGALQYDIASLLYDAKADIPQNVRNILFSYYLDKISEIIKVDRNEFNKFYQGYSLIRIMQAMGAYGFRGFYEKKTHFLQSIPFAIENMKYILDNLNLPVKIHTLIDVLNKIPFSENILNISNQTSNLTVTVNSFSYKRQIPHDESGNGGGFVFDCRAIKNPGTEERFKTLTGKDPEIIDFLDAEPDSKLFLDNVFSIVEQSVNKYKQRGFTSLMVNFGCTGGQHRSVYCAEKLAKHLKQNFNVNISLHHREQEIKK